MPISYKKNKISHLENEIGGIYGPDFNQSDSDNSGPLWYGDPLIKNTHVRNPGRTFNDLKMTNKRFHKTNPRQQEIRNRRNFPTKEQKNDYKTRVFKRSTAYYVIPDRYRHTVRESGSRDYETGGAKWYQNAIDWLMSPDGDPPEICKYLGQDNSDGSNIYDCVTIHDVDDSGEGSNLGITFKDLNMILCGMDDAYCVVDYCHPHCNSWYNTTTGDLVNQDCGKDGCGNQCGAWYGVEEDGCAPNGYNSWPYWHCTSSGVSFTGEDGITRPRRYCKGSYSGPPPGSCFIEGTEISMADGSNKSIEEVEVGDVVKTYNEETEKIENNKVLNLQKPVREGYYNLRYGDDDKLLGVTDEHPLYSARMADEGVTELGWRSLVPESTLSGYPHLKFVGQLNINDYVLDDNLDWHKINSIEYIEGEIQTYNLWSVENTNTFFAGGLLAHNKCFIAGTMVLTTTEDEKPIEDIRVGDEVWGYTEEGNLVKNKVSNLMVHEIGGDLVKVYTRKGHITGTKNHPLLAKTHLFKYKKEIFTNIEDLSIGDYLLDAKGNPLEIISIEDVEKEQVSYNLEITGENRTYIANGYRVHNARIPKSRGTFGDIMTKHEYPNRAMHPLQNPRRTPWLYYHLDKCEHDYIFGFRKTPCPGDKIPPELHPIKTLENVLGDVPGVARSDPRQKQRWLMQKYHEKLTRGNPSGKLSNTTIRTISRDDILEHVVEEQKIGPPNIPT